MKTLALVLLCSCGDREEPDADDDGYPDQEDCNDDDPTVNPDAVEIWYDQIDQNCDATDDASLAFVRVPGDDEGTNVAGPRFARLQDRVQLNLLFANDGMNTGGRGTATFDGTTGDLSGDKYVGLAQDDGSALLFGLGRVVDAAGYPETDDLLAASLLTSAGDRLAALLLFEEESYSMRGNGGSGDNHFEDVAISVEGDVISVAACNDRGTSWQSGTMESFVAITQDTAISDLEGAGHSCGVVGSEVRVLNDEGIVTEYTGEGADYVAGVGSVLVPGQTWKDVVDFAWEPGAYLLAREDHLVLKTDVGSTEIVTSEPPVRVRLDVSGDQVFIVYADAAGDLFLLYGPPEGPFLEGRLNEGLATADLDVEATPGALFVGSRTRSEVWYASIGRPD